MQAPEELRGLLGRVIKSSYCSVIRSMTRRYALTDAQWDHIKDLLPGRAGHVGRPAANVACLLRLCCFATVPVCPGAICLSALATFA